MDHKNVGKTQRLRGLLHKLQETTILVGKLYETRVSGTDPRVSDLAHCTGGPRAAGVSHGIITYYEM